MGEHERYALSFTSGGLLVREGEVAATIYLDARDWAATRVQIVEGNLFQARTTSSSVRTARETVQRVTTLTDAEIQLLTESSFTERQQLMWVAACRRYGLVGDFAEEVLRERFLLMTPLLGYEEFDRFIAGKSLWHPELDELKPSTAQKLRQSLFRMLHEGGLRTPHGDIVPAVLSERIIDALNQQRPSDLRFFPTTTPTEVKR